MSSANLSAVSCFPTACVGHFSLPTAVVLDRFVGGSKEKATSGPILAKEAVPEYYLATLSHPVTGLGAIMTGRNWPLFGGINHRRAKLFVF